MNLLENFHHDKALRDRILRMAQFEAELELGVNPLDTRQANVANLSKEDFNYIDRVNALVEKRFADTKWMRESIRHVKKYWGQIPESRGIGFNDELYKSGRGILQGFLAAS